jgi:hypothetical protein
MNDLLKDRAPNIDELVRKLEICGYKFLRFEINCDDECLPVDVEWNYKDLVHVGFVHSHMSRQFLYTGKNIYTTIDLQKFLGITLPQSGVFYVTDDNRIVVHTTLFFYVIFVEIHSEKIGEMLTRTETHYAVGARSWFLNLFSPLLRFVISRNWSRFIKDDRPMRSRRGDLRKQGFEIADVSPIDHRATLNIADVGIKLPSTMASIEERISEFVVPDHIGQTQLVGDADHFGVQVQFDEGEIRIFPRLCTHRGASLDMKESIGSSVVCPWHGRKFSPLARIEIDQGAQSFEGPFHHCKYDGEKLMIRTRANVASTDSIDWTAEWARV